MKAKPKAGMKLHHFVALGGKPSAFRGATANAVANKSKKK